MRSENMPPHGIEMPDTLIVGATEASFLQCFIEKKLVPRSH
jgi:hypothetical protein